MVLRTTKRHVADCEKILKFTKIGSVTHHKLIQTAITDPGYKNKVGKEKIKIKKVPLADLGAPLTMPVEPVVAGFLITPEDGSLCIKVPSTVTPDIKLKK